MIKRQIPDGIHNIPSSLYHSSAGINRSALWAFRRSPGHYWYEYEKPKELDEEQKEELTTGALLHTLILEPEKYRKEFIQMPKIDRRTKQGKADYADFLVEAEGKQIITLKQYEQCIMMAERIKSDKLFTALIQNCQIEKSIYWTEPTTGLQCKVRPDAWSKVIVTDLKTTKDASYKAMQRAAYSYGYYLQAGMISCALKSLGERLEQFVLACIEKKYPFATGLYILKEDAIEYGETMFHELIEKLKIHLDSDEWPFYRSQVLEVPHYVIYDEEN